MTEYKVRVDFESRFRGDLIETFIVYSVRAPTGGVAKDRAKEKAEELGSFVSHKKVEVVEVVE